MQKHLLPKPFKNCTEKQCTMYSLHTVQFGDCTLGTLFSYSGLHRSLSTLYSECIHSQNIIYANVSGVTLINI